jgi:hypothetical protein
MTTVLTASNGCAGGLGVGHTSFHVVTILMTTVLTTSNGCAGGLRVGPGSRNELISQTIAVEPPAPVVAANVQHQHRVRNNEREYLCCPRRHVHLSANALD